MKKSMIIGVLENPCRMKKEMTVCDSCGQVIYGTIYPVEHPVHRSMKELCVSCWSRLQPPKSWTSSDSTLYFIRYTDSATVIEKL